MKNDHADDDNPPPIGHWATRLLEHLAQKNESRSCPSKCRLWAFPKMHRNCHCQKLPLPSSQKRLGSRRTSTLIAWRNALTTGTSRCESQGSRTLKECLQHIKHLDLKTMVIVKHSASMGHALKCPWMCEFAVREPLCPATTPEFPLISSCRGH